MPLRKSGTVRTHRSEGERGHPARISRHLAGVQEKPLVCVLLRRPPARCRRQRAGSPRSPSTPCSSEFSGEDSLEVSAVEGVVISLQALSLGRRTNFFRRIAITGRSVYTGVYTRRKKTVSACNSGEHTRPRVLASAPSPTRTFASSKPRISRIGTDETSPCSFVYSVVDRLNASFLSEDAFGGAPKAAREGACAPQSPVSDVLARIGGPNNR